MSDLAPAPGILLIAPPILDDPNFERSVVYLCQTDADGAFGLVLNQPTDLLLAALLDGFERYDRPVQIRQGGPVQPETLHVLHRAPGLVDGGEDLPGGVTWGGDLESLVEAFASNDADAEDFAFFLGYAGWAPGQLDEEIARGDWLLTTARAEDLFETAPEDLWKAVLRRMGAPHSYLVHFPADPRLN